MHLSQQQGAAPAGTDRGLSQTQQTTVLRTIDTFLEGADVAWRDGERKRNLPEPTVGAWRGPNQLPIFGDVGDYPRPKRIVPTHRSWVYQDSGRYRVDAHAVHSRRRGLAGSFQERLPR